MKDEDWDIVAAAHDALHKGDIDEAHAILHRALGADEPPPKTHVSLVMHRRFDEAFRTACKKNGVRAMYIILEPTSPTHARVITGGDAAVCATIDPLLRSS